MTDQKFTRCPGCATVFRVTAAQLALREGQVRCGHCRAVFDANDHFVLLDDATAERQPDPDDELARGRPTVTLRSSEALLPVPPAVAPDVGSAGAVAGDEFLARGEEPGSGPHTDGFSDEARADGGTPGQAPTDAGSADAETADAGTADAGTADAGTADAGTADAESADAESADAESADAESDDAESADAGAADAGTTDAGSAEEGTGDAGSVDEAAAADRVSVDGTTGDALPAAATAPVAAPPVDMRDVDRASRFQWKTRKEPSERPRAVYAAAILVLVLAVVLQGVLEFRDALAAHVPATRTLLANACRALSCTIEPLRDAAALSIDASDLQADPAHRGLLLLSATLRNRAAHAIAFPHLELTLTDSTDRIVARRAFAPAEYAGGTADLHQGIAANAERLVKLFIDASATQQAGYRLYLFYP
jgi:predicted Zn finger-like uncharacterized protein